MSLPRICTFGAYSPDYPRNLILRRGLELQGVEVVECRVSSKLNTRERGRALSGAFAELVDSCDVILLAEFSASLAPLAWWLAKRHRKKLVVDVFTSMYDSAVHDRGTARAGSVRAWRHWLIDWASLTLPSVALADTEQHKAYFVDTFGVSENKVNVIPVGASREWFETSAHPHHYDGKRLVQFYGTYIPLHGIDTILRAASQLRDREDIVFELIGSGQTYKAMQSLAGELALDNVMFRPSVPAAELPALVSRADLCLGIFGETEKTGRVVPNKVYQTLALGKPVITGDTPAIREAFEVGKHLLVSPPGDAEKLAETIRTTVVDPGLMDALGKAGREKMESAYSEARLGSLLLEAIQ